MAMLLGQSDLKVPPLGLGAMVWGDMSHAPRLDPARNAYGPTSSFDDQRDALEASLVAGVNLVDTAARFGDGASEQRVGELTEGRDVLVATTFPTRRAGTFRAALAASLTRLRRSTIDLYQLPSRWAAVPDLLGHLADAVAAGTVRAVGVSNLTADQVRTAYAALAARGIPLASHQVRYSLLHRAPEVDGVLAAGRELGVTTIAYTPLASGALTGRYDALRRPAGWRRYSPSFRGRGLSRVVQLTALLQDIAAGHGATPGQVALRWLVDQPDVLPIPGAKNGRQARDNAGALTVELTPAERDALSAATAPAG